MAVTGMHHFNIRVSLRELEVLRDFYSEVVGLRIGPRPSFRSAGVWLYAGARPIVHLTQMNSGEVVSPDSPHDLPEPRERRSAVDHIALACDDLDEAVRRLTRHRVRYTMSEVPAVGEIQLFLRDPAGTGIELIFARPDRSGAGP